MVPIVCGCGLMWHSKPISLAKKREYGTADRSLAAERGVA
jgi:hypothetical protein